MVGHMMIRIHLNKSRTQNGRTHDDLESTLVYIFINQE